MAERVLSVIGGMGLFVALLSFAQAALAADAEAALPWSVAMAFGLVAFLWSVFRRRTSGTADR